MYPLYKDLREKLGEPLWIDQHGVPRYAEFNPSLLGIYDSWAVLFVVRCQACGDTFVCASGCDPLMEAMTSGHNAANTDFEEIQKPMNVLQNLTCWGDAPWHTHQGDQDAFDGQCAGTTMCADVVGIIEAWHKPSMGEWKEFELTSEQIDSLTEAP